MSGLGVVMFMLSMLGLIACIPLGIQFFCEYDGSLALWRAARKRAKAQHEKAVYFMSLGYDKTDALRKADRALDKEAEATEKEMPA